MNRIKRGCLALSLVVCSVAASSDPYAVIVSYQQQGHYKQALAEIETLLAQNKNDYRALLLKGNVNKMMGNTEKAIAIFKQLIKDHPHMPEPYNNLAVLYADNGKTALAVETLQQVFDTSDSYSAAFKNLRNLYDEMAAMAYREALDIKQNKKTSKSSKYTLLNETAAAPEQAVEPPQPKVVETKTGVQDSQGVDADILAAIDSWSKDWSAGNPKAYFSHYHRSFVPPNGVSLKQWHRSRSVRLKKPKFIKVEVVGVSVQHKADNVVTAMFEQHYQSDNYKDTVVKVLTLKKEKDQWQIIKEDVL